MADVPLTRRALLKLAGSGAAAAAASTTADRSEAGAQPQARRSRPAREPLRALAAHEADLLDRIAELLIPSDELGPGATEAMAVRYIDRALAGALAEQREAYRVGLAALDRYARETRGAPFLQLPETRQISVLIDVETGTATGANVGFQGSSAQFFALLRGHVWQGTFGDPHYGGNAGFVGWDLIGYPGVRTYVGPAEQRLLSPPTAVRRSAYDTPMFEKAVVDVRPGRSDRDAD
jgi:gluconate 2-dehydrogenase gamma chain